MTGPEFADGPEEDEDGGGEGGTKNARTRTRLSRDLRALHYSRSVLWPTFGSWAQGYMGTSSTPHSPPTVCYSRASPSLGKSYWDSSLA